MHTDATRSRQIIGDQNLNFTVTVSSEPILESGLFRVPMLLVGVVAPAAAAPPNGYVEDDKSTKQVSYTCT